jgi:hypothetical protein
VNWFGAHPFHKQESFCSHARCPRHCPAPLGTATATPGIGGRQRGLWRPGHPKQKARTIDDDQTAASTDAIWFSARSMRLGLAGRTVPTPGWNPYKGNTEKADRRGSSRSACSRFTTCRRRGGHTPAAADGGSDRGKPRPGNRTAAHAERRRTVRTSRSAA